MKHRRGFTLIEILVACSVIVILMGLLFLGGKAIVTSNKKTSTKTTLNNLRAMVTEREAAVGATKVKSEFQYYYGNVPLNAGLNIPNMSRGSVSRTPTSGANQLFFTQEVMKILVSVPVNKKAISNIPNEQLLEHDPSNPWTTGDNETPILLDAFDNPIIAVPSQGINLKFEVGTSPQLVQSKDGKPFFMSAGPDGDYNTADDNIFSYEN